MAIVKKSELREIDIKKLDSKLNELRDRMIKVNFQRSTKTTPDNSGQVKEVRRTIAKLLQLRKKLKSKPKGVKEEKPKESEKKA